MTKAPIRNLFPILALIGLSGLPIETARTSEALLKDAGFPASIPPANMFDQPTLGPEMLYGATPQQPQGRPYGSVKIRLSGAATHYRVFFDRQDEQFFHFLDRAGEALVLGLCESGVEQVLGRGRLTAATLPEVVVIRQGSWLSVYGAGRLALFAFDARRKGGTVGFRRADQTCALKADVAAIEEIRFDDDFMRQDSDGSVWRTIHKGAGEGSFAIRALDNPVLSANAFCYMGEGRDVMAVVGEGWWDNYIYEVSMRGPKGNKMGLVFAWQDEHHYGLFRWVARPVDLNGVPLGPGRRELICVVEGEEQVLVEAPGGYLPDQWYRARIRLHHDRVTVSIDGHVLFDVVEPRLAAGGVGVWCDVEPLASAHPRAVNYNLNSLHDLLIRHAVFDDVRVRTDEGLAENFRSPGPLAGGWFVGWGTWEVATGQDVQAGEVRVACGTQAGLGGGAGVSKSLIGDPVARDYALDCEVALGASAEARAGLVFLHQDESNYYAAVVGQKGLQLLCTADGQTSVVDSCSRIEALSELLFERLQVRAKQGHVVAWVGEGLRVETFDERPGLQGRVGLWASNPEGRGVLCFRRFRMERVGDPEPLISTNAIFQHESDFMGDTGDLSNMGDWADPQHEWQPQLADFRVDGQKVIPLWHRGCLPGDVEFVVEPREILEGRHEVALSIAKDGQGGMNGYVFRYVAGKEDPSVARLFLVRSGKTVHEQRFPVGSVRDLQSVALRRAGRYVIGKVNGHPAIQFRDEEPLRGAKVAYYSRGMLIRQEAVKLLSEQVHDERFSVAPVDWRVSGPALFEVTNRWICDPRWTFASLENDRRIGKPAILWSKRRMGGDFSLECFIGLKMASSTERGPMYQYARDINITVCSDGQDLTKGYTFMFGGRGNQGSMVYRAGVEVMRIPRVKIPTDVQANHRHWYAIRLEKQGGRFLFRVDTYFDRERGGALVFEDAHPLSGDRIAIWTYDNALMLGRITLAGEGGDELEPLDVELRSPKTIYDLP